MEKFPQKNQPKESEKPSELLGQWDRDVLEKGVKGVVEHMLADFKGQLPDIIVLPETAARPLMYTLRPIFKMLNEKRGLVTPSFVFMNTATPDHSLLMAELSKNNFDERGIDSLTVDTSAELKEYERTSLVDYETGELPSYATDDYIDDIVQTSNPEGLKRARETMKERAGEIFALRPGAKIAVVDEFIAAGSTFNEILRAFGTDDIHAYAVFSENLGPAGTFVSWSRKEGNPTEGGKLKLSYSGQDAIGVKKQSLRKSEDHCCR
jgi:hypothetical protein